MKSYPLLTLEEVEEREVFYRESLAWELQALAAALRDRAQIPLKKAQEKCLGEAAQSQKQADRLRRKANWIYGERSRLLAVADQLRGLEEKAFVDALSFAEAAENKLMVLEENQALAAHLRAMTAEERLAWEQEGAAASERVKALQPVFEAERRAATSDRLRRRDKRYEEIRRTAPPSQSAGGGDTNNTTAAKAASQEAKNV